MAGIFSYNLPEEPSKLLSKYIEGKAKEPDIAKMYPSYAAKQYNPSQESTSIPQETNVHKWKKKDLEETPKDFTAPEKALSREKKKRNLDESPKYIHAVDKKNQAPSHDLPKKPLLPKNRNLDESPLGSMQYQEDEKAIVSRNLDESPKMELNVEEKDKRIRNLDEAPKLIKPVPVVQNEEPSSLPPTKEGFATALETRHQQATTPKEPNSQVSPIISSKTPKEETEELKKEYFKKMQEHIEEKTKKRQEEKEKEKEFYEMQNKMAEERKREQQRKRDEQKREMELSKQRKNQVRMQAKKK